MSGHGEWVRMMVSVGIALVVEEEEEVMESLDIVHRSKGLGEGGPEGNGKYGEGGDEV